MKNTGGRTPSGKKHTRSFRSTAVTLAAARCAACGKIQEDIERLLYRFHTQHPNLYTAMIIPLHATQQITESFELEAELEAVPEIVTSFAVPVRRCRSVTEPSASVLPPTIG